MRKRNEFELIETDMGIYGPDMVAFLKARAAKKRAKTDLREANAIYQKAKADLEALRDNFNAAFESSAEKENWTDLWINTISVILIISWLIMIKLD